MSFQTLVVDPRKGREKKESGGERNYAGAEA